MNRILSLDLARGFTVLFIPIVHSVMLYGDQTTHESAFGKVLSFIAEWPGAQIFMMLMGISFAISAQKSFRTVLVRSIVLMILGYLLNVLKFVIPFLLGGLPEAFLIDMMAGGWQSLLMVGDILQFAAISLLVLWLVQRFPDPTLTALLLGMFVAFATPFPFQTIELISGHPPKVFFPLFPWLVYPLAGFAIGQNLGSSQTPTTDGRGRRNDNNKVFPVLFLLGCGLMLSSYVAEVPRRFAEEAPRYARDDNFYVSGPWPTFMHLGFAAVWISAWHFVTRISVKNIKLFFAKALFTSKKKITIIYENPKWIDNLLFRFLYFLSRRITVVYFIQWPLIFWLLPVFGYHKLDVYESLVIALDISILVFGIAYLIHKKNRNLLV